MLLFLETRYNNKKLNRHIGMLHIKNLCVEIAGKQILQNINLAVDPGTIHALMGPNGSGKSTLSLCLMGHPAYTITSGSADLNAHDLNALTPDKRAQAGLFLSFQQPYTLPGVRAHTFLLEAYRAITGTMISVPDFKKLLDTEMERLSIDPAFAYRDVNDGFSGGEKKKFELLQLVLLKPKLAILDEIDSGLDIDALKIVAKGIAYAREQNPTMSIIIITHYHRILQQVIPDYVHIMNSGTLVASGDAQLIQGLDLKGYDAYR